jgi:type IV pilus assembly protein PilM
LEDGGTDSEAGQMKVLLVAVKKALIEDHISLLQSVGLTPAIVDVDVFAIGNAFELRNLSLGIADEEIRALVDIGASKTNINIMRGNKSYFHREIYVAGNDLTDAVAKRFGEDPKDVEKMKKDPGGALESMQDAMLPVLEDIGNEIKLSFDYYENQYDQVVKEVYLSGGTVYFPGIDTMLSQIFSLPTKIWDPTEGLEITNFTPGGVGGSNSDMAIALGLASRLLGTVGRVSSVAPAPAATAPGAEDRAVMDTKPPEMAAPPTTPSTASWAKGIAAGFGMSAVIAAALLFANVKGYEMLWVILEGIPLGLAAGAGLWMGIKSVRPLPTRAGIVFSSLAITLLCCGGLLAGRYYTGKPMKKQQTPKKLKLPTNVDLPTLPAEVQAKIAASRKARAASQGGKRDVDIDDITALIYMLAHWMLAAFCAVQISTFNLRKIEKQERAVAI